MTLLVSPIRLHGLKHLLLGGGGLSLELRPSFRGSAGILHFTGTGAVEDRSLRSASQAQLRGGSLEPPDKY